MTDIKKIEVELPEIVFDELRYRAEQHGQLFNAELVSVLEEYLTLSPEFLEMANDISSLRSELEFVRKETSDFEAEVSRRIKLLLHLPA